MPRLIQTKLTDIDKKFMTHIANLMRFEVDKYQSKNNTTREFVAKKAWISQGRLSWILGNFPINDRDSYLRIAQAIGLTDHQFNSIIEEAKREIFWSKEEPTLKHALSKELGNNEEAMRDIDFAIRVAKERYWIK